MGILNFIFGDSKTKQRMQDYDRQLMEENKELKKEVENTPCEKCKKIDWELIDTNVEPFPGWDDIIDGNYKCKKCGNKKTKRIQNPN